MSENKKSTFHTESEDLYSQHKTISSKKEAAAERLKKTGKFSVLRPFVNHQLRRVEKAYDRNLEESKKHLKDNTLLYLDDAYAEDWYSTPRFEDTKANKESKQPVDQKTLTALVDAIAIRALSGHEFKDQYISDLKMDDGGPGLLSVSLYKHGMVKSDSGHELVAAMTYIDDFDTPGPEPIDGKSIHYEIFKAGEELGISKVYSNPIEFTGSGRQERPLGSMDGIMLVMVDLESERRNVLHRQEQLGLNTVYQPEAEQLLEILPHANTRRGPINSNA